MTEGLLSGMVCIIVLAAEFKNENSMKGRFIGCQVVIITNQVCERYSLLWTFRPRRLRHDSQGSAKNKKDKGGDYLLDIAYEVRIVGSNCLYKGLH